MFMLLCRVVAEGAEDSISALCSQAAGGRLKDGDGVSDGLCLPVQAKLGTHDNRRLGADSVAKRGRLKSPYRAFRRPLCRLRRRAAKGV